MAYSKIRVLVLASAVASLYAVAIADTVTLAPPDGVSTNVLALFTGDTAVEVAGPGAVKLNPSNMHTGGTTLSGGTLVLSGDIQGGGGYRRSAPEHSPSPAEPSAAPAPSAVTSRERVSSILRHLKVGRSPETTRLAYL